MKIKNIHVGIFLLGLLFAVLLLPDKRISAQDVSNEHLEDLDILVRFKDHKLPDQKNELAYDLGYRKLRYYRQFKLYKWRPDQRRRASLKNTLKRLRNNPDVEWAEPNYLRHPDKIPNDPFFNQQWHLVNSGQTGGLAGADIKANDAWDVSVPNFPSVVVVMDTGIDYNHPDLRENIWHNIGEDWLSDGSPGFNGLDDDNNGYIDDYYGINVEEQNPLPPIPFPPPIISGARDPMDTNGHGTHVAGIIGASGNNGFGVSGINWNTSLMALKFIGPAGGTVAGELECIEYILDQKERGAPIYVVNASYGGPNFSQFEEEAFERLRDKGILVAAAAGNSADDLDSGSQNFPASYSLENIISIAATTDHDRLSDFSNYGRNSVDLGAPGSKIYSTFLEGSYKQMGGTSMAVPQVAGAIALIHANFDSTFFEAKERIFRGVDPLESLYGRVFTNGRLNLRKVLTVRLEGPFIFSIYPTIGSAGTKVTLSGIRFGSHEDASGVTFGGVEADIISWEDEKIECLVPDGGMTDEFMVFTKAGESNGVIFSRLSLFQYFLPFSPCGDPWESYLILTNFNAMTVNLRVRASKAGGFVVNTFSESLLPMQSVYRNLKEYGLEDFKVLLSVESEKDITVGIVAYYFGGGMNDFAFIEAQRR